MAIDDQLIDELLKDYRKPEDLVGETGLLKELTKRLVERALDAEMTEHLGYKKHAPEGKNNGTNSRNGHSKKTIQGEFGQAEIAVPRDRESQFEPQLVQKGQRRFEGFDQKIVSLYARGMTTRDIQSHLEEIYGAEISSTLISNVTAEVAEDVKLWQSRPLEAVYPVVYFDALWVKSRDEGHVRNKAVYIALGVNMEGRKEVLGLWIARTEGAKFWLQVLTELRNRGLQDIFIACVDGLKGFPEAIASQFPQTDVQLCIVHLVRNSLKYVNWKQRKAVAADLKKIYSASIVEEAEMALERFGETWDQKYPVISRSWRANWENVITFFSYPHDIRKAIYTTNAIESLNHSMRKVIKNRGAFPDDDAIMKILYLALQNVARKWIMPIQNWNAALNHFAILFPERMPA